MMLLTLCHVVWPCDITHALFKLPGKNLITEVSKTHQRFSVRTTTKNFRKTSSSKCSPFTLLKRKTGVFKFLREFWEVFSKSFVVRIIVHVRPNRTEKWSCVSKLLGGSVNAFSVLTKQSTWPLALEIITAPAILTVITIIFNYAHSCVSLANWDHTKQCVMCY